jgi:hypothetical protein
MYIAVGKYPLHRITGRWSNQPQVLPKQKKKEKGEAEL